MKQKSVYRLALAASTALVLTCAPLAASDSSGKNEPSRKTVRSANTGVQKNMPPVEIDDMSITAKVMAALLANHPSSAANTNVKVRNGEVTLAGTAKDEAEKALITKTASEVRGVVRVNNLMTVTKPPKV